MPTSPSEVTAFMRATGPAWAALDTARQEAEVFTTLGWNANVRNAATNLATELLGLGVAVQMPEALVSIGVPESGAVLGGDQEFWGRVWSGFSTGSDDVDELVRIFSSAISE